MKKALLVIVLAGLMLRLYGAGHGLAAGRVFHPDTPKQMMFLNHFIEGDYRVRFRMHKPDYHGYPAFHIHIAEWAYRALRSMARLSGYFDWELAPFHLWLFVRVLTALFSTLSILLVFFTGKELFSEKAGLFSAALFASHPFSTGMSHFIMGDTAMTFFVLAAFYMFVLCFKKQQAWMYLAGGILAGMAAACKYNGAFIVIPGIFALLMKPGKKTVFGLSALFFGAALGFTIGNPSMFTYFSEGVRAAVAFSAHTSTVRWDASQPRILAAIGAAPSKLRMFAGLFGFWQFFLALFAFAWIIIKKRSLKSVFAVLFPSVYFVLIIVAYPVLMPLHFLVMVPFLMLAAGWFLSEAGCGKIFYTRSLSAGVVLLLVFQVYSSYRESFLFAAGDTRISAGEWAASNAAAHFEIKASGYSVQDLNRGGEKVPGAGGIFILSSLAGMPSPEGGVLLKEFSHEDSIPSVTFRNPDIRVFARYGDELRQGFKLPVFNRLPHEGVIHGPLFPGGVEFGADPFTVFLRAKKGFSIASKEPLSDIPVLLVNFERPSEVRVKIGLRTKKIKMEAFESRLLTFEKPLRRAPFHRYYYDMQISTKTPSARVFVRAGFTPEQKAMVYFEGGDFIRAASYFASAQDGRLCPAEREIMRAYSYYRAGDFEKANTAAKNINFWAENYFSIPGGGADDARFSDVFLENTGISIDYLEDVNTAIFQGGAFTSTGGEAITRGVKNREKLYSHLIECSGGGGGVIFGPYSPLPPGSYKARFMFNVESFFPDARIRLDAASRVGAKVLAEKELDFSAQAGSAQAVLFFEVEEVSEFLEFRTFIEGNCKIELLGVYVTPDIEKNTRDKLRMLNAARGG